MLMTRPSPEPVQDPRGREQNYQRGELARGFRLSFGQGDRDPAVGGLSADSSDIGDAQEKGAGNGALVFFRIIPTERQATIPEIGPVVLTTQLQGGKGRLALSPDTQAPRTYFHTPGKISTGTICTMPFSGESFRV